MVTDIARRALDLWDLAGSTLELVGVSENTTFRVETPEGEAVVLRVHRLGYHDAEELASEVVWTRALNQVGLSAPAARLSRTGRSHETVDDPVSGETRLVGIAEWVEGETVADLLGADASEADLVPRFAQLGRIAAAIHNQAWSRSATRDGCNPRPSLVAIQQQISLIALRSLSASILWVPSQPPGRRK